MAVFPMRQLSLFIISLFLLKSQALAPLEPETGVWFGVNMDNQIMQREYPTEYGVNPVTFGTFIEIPMRAEDFLYLGEFLDQVAERRGIALVTLEPNGGLDQVSESAVRQLAELLLSYAIQGVSFLIRFAHEMNGSWYPWSQQPSLHKAKFRLTASILHSTLPNRLAMLWAPNNGAGYPFTGGAYCCSSPSTCSDYEALDTNSDGVIDEYDDMYDPYYPGDDAVDWVGMTLYHWGSTFPWGNNTVAELRSFYNKLTGRYTGIQGNETMIPDFYSAYCVDGVHNKPMAIPETAALFNVNSTCCVSELEVKKSWWGQVFNVQGDTESAVDVRLHLPKLKMINWFDIKKPESEIWNQVADWTFSNNDEIRSEFVNMLIQPATDGEKYWMQLESFHEYLENLSEPPLEKSDVQ